MVQAYNYIVNTAQRWVSSIWNAMTQFVQRVVNGFLNVVRSVGNGMRNALNKVRSFISAFVQAGIDLIAGLIKGIVQKAKDLAAAAWNAAKGALNAAKSALDSHSPSREFMKLGNDSMTGLGMGITQFAGKAARDSKLAALKVMDSFDKNFQPDLNTSLSSDLTDGLGSSLNDSVDAHMSKDVRHSLQENNRPIVNVNVRNESDIPAIKSYIEETNSKAAVISQF